MIDERYYIYSPASINKGTTSTHYPCHLIIWQLGDLIHVCSSNSIAAYSVTNDTDTSFTAWTLIECNNAIENTLSVYRKVTYVSLPQPKYEVGLASYLDNGTNNIFLGKNSRIKVRKQNTYSNGEVSDISTMIPAFDVFYFKA